ncbi:alpha/beta family hydrolase [Microbacterium sp. Root180]|uniref:alpha/beta hydrolase family protein n=1 Tax=Microbacterium sp. Root180 TaxID=1736483 RepID=UPI000A71EC89|nr:alpha/beta family hydrolase [Microbacterium sp. Root180]
MHESDLRIPVQLPAGEVEISAAYALPEGAWALVAVAHGAGAGMRHPFLSGFVGALHADGVATLRFNFPYLEAGRRMPGPAAHAIATWSAVAATADAQAPGLPFWAAGKSYGGRMASMAAAESAISPAGLVYLGYPLHPPGSPDKARTAHLPDIAQAQLFVEGSKDPFIDPLDQFERAVASCRDAETVWIDGGGHSFEVKGHKRSADDIGAGIAPLVVEWMRRRSQRPAA